MAYSQKVVHFGYNLQKMVPNHNPEYYPPEGWIWHICGRLEPYQILSENTPPLATMNLYAVRKLYLKT